MWGAIAKGAATLLAWIGIDFAIEKWIVPTLSNLGGSSKTKSDETVESIKKDLANKNAPDVQARAFSVMLLSTLADIISTMDVPIDEYNDSNRSLREDVSASLATNPSVCLPERTRYASVLIDGSEECESAALAEMYVRYSEEQGQQMLTAVDDSGNADLGSLAILFANMEDCCPEAFVTAKRALMSYELAMSAVPATQSVVSTKSSVRAASENVGDKDKTVVDDPLSFAYAGKYIDNSNSSSQDGWTDTVVPENGDYSSDDVTVDLEEEDNSERGIG